VRRLVLCLLAVMFAASSASALTLAEFRYRVSFKLNQDTTATTKHWANAELNIWINDGIRFVSGATLCYKRDTAFCLDTNKTKYTMPADFIKVYGVKMGSRGATSELTRSPLGLKSASSADMGKESGDNPMPTEWEDGGEKTKILTVTPAPQLFDTLTVTYYAYAPRLTLDTSTCALPEVFQYPVSEYAASEAYSRTGLPDHHWQKFLDRLSIVAPTLQMGTDPEVPAATARPNQ